MRTILKNLLFGGALYYSAAPNAAVDLQTGQAVPMLHAGPRADYVLPPAQEPRYVVPLPGTGAGGSFYVDPTPGEPD